jgi:predicted nucleotidyltransferase component of viral defense system
MRAVLGPLQSTPMVLKGGTALLLCYGLDRFSEDLDFDSPKKLNLESRLEQALSAGTLRHEITRTKDTATVLRYRVIYAVPEVEGRLKIEISFRDEIRESTVVSQKGIRTYIPAQLIRQKLGAFCGRTAARDLYDLHFLAARYHDQFDGECLVQLKAAFADLDQVEARFRPAFEDDDLFREQTDLIPRLVLGIQAVL